MKELVSAMPVALVGSSCNGLYVYLVESCPRTLLVGRGYV